MGVESGFVCTGGHVLISHLFSNSEQIFKCHLVLGEVAGEISCVEFDPVRMPQAVDVLERIN